VGQKGGRESQQSGRANAGNKAGSIFMMEKEALNQEGGESGKFNR